MHFCGRVYVKNGETAPLFTEKKCKSRAGLQPSGGNSKNSTKSRQ